jgi:hypothetical protein
MEYDSLKLFAQAPGALPSDITKANFNPPTTTSDMDEKRNSLLRTRLNRRNRPALTLILVGAVFFIVWYRSYSSSMAGDRRIENGALVHSPAEVVPANKPVPVEAHIISKCPDTRVSTKIFNLVNIKIKIKIKIKKTPRVDDGGWLMVGRFATNRTASG